MSGFDMDGDDCDDNRVKVSIPGPPGPPLINVGSFLSPIDVSAGTIPAPVNRFQRTFISAVSNSVSQPVIPNPADNGSWLWMLQCVNGDPIVINNAANIKLSGQIILNPDTILTLIWDGNSRYVEVSRNEI